MKNIKELTEVMKVLKGHLTFFLEIGLCFFVCFKSEVGFCEQRGIIILMN